MKTIKFTPELVLLIKSGEKTTTWRLWDDKDLQVNDHVQFIDRLNMSPFAEVTLTQVVEKKFGDITDEDKVGHEDMGDKANMYAVFAGYYNKPVDDDTVIKIIRFHVDRFL